MIFKKAMITDDRSDINHLSFFSRRGFVLAFSDSGDTYRIDDIPGNAYGYGDLGVYASILDGFGWEWYINPLSLRLEKSNSCVKYDRNDFEVISEISGYGCSGRSLVRGTYISDVLSVGDDFGFWKDLSWSQNLYGQRIVVAVKSGRTSEEVVGKDWERYFEVPSSYYDYGAGQAARIDLDRFNLKGSHFMFKVQMETEVSSEKPVVTDLKVSYAAKHSVYFFTNKIRIDSEGFNNVIVTASHTSPIRTELSYAVGPSESVSWDEYSIVDLGSLEPVPASFGNGMRFGIRLSSFDAVNVPTVHEFAIEFAPDTDKQVNIEGMS
jgi:hypothetical protein